MELLYSGSGITAYHRRVEDSPLIAVVWANWSMRSPLWASETESVSAIYIVPDADHWYQSVDLDALTSAIRPVTAVYERRLSIGSSMGAFSAIALSSALDATRIVAFCPQFTQDRQVIDDHRWATEWAAIAEHRHQITAQGVECHLIYDPRDHLDMIHAARIKDAIPDAYLWEFEYSGHPPTFTFADLNCMQWLFESILADVEGPYLLKEFLAAYNSHGTFQSITSLRQRISQLPDADFKQLLIDVDPVTVRGFEKTWHTAHWLTARRLVRLIDASEKRMEDANAAVLRLKGSGRDMALALKEQGKEIDAIKAFREKAELKLEGRSWALWLAFSNAVLLGIIVLLVRGNPM